MAYDLDLIRDCAKDEAAYRRLLQHLGIDAPDQDPMQETFARVFRFSPDPIVITRLEDGKALAINDAFINYTGYTEEEYRTSNPHLWKDRSKRHEMVDTLREDGYVHNLPVEFYHKNKSTLHGLLSGEIINYQGEESLLVMVRDVTDNVITNRKLQASEERYRRVVETQTEVICTYTPDMRFTFTNEAYCEYFGYSTEGIIGKSILEFVPEAIHEKIRSQVAHILETKQAIEYVGEGMDANGEWRWIQWIDQPILDADGHVLEIQAVGRDITERTQAEMRLQLLLSSLPRTAFLMFNQHLAFTVVEGNILEFIGLRSDESIGKKPTEIFVKPYGRLAEDHMLRVLMGEELEVEEQVFNRMMRFQMYPIREGESHTIIGGATVVEDITERKEAEQKALQFTLERNRVQVITDFITKAQHEFRTPLSVIASSLYIAERVDNRERQLRSLRKARGQVDAIGHLVDELTMMARLDADIETQDHTKQKTNPHYLIMLATENVSAEARQHGVNLAHDFADDVPMLNVYQRMISEALVQLLKNAIDHTPQDGTVTVGTRYHDDVVDIFVRDTGEGMAPDVMARVFERFYRKDMAHSTRGFGLGLPIAEKIIQIHGGTMSVDSVPDEGSTFTITLPVDPQEDA